MTTYTTPHFATGPSDRNVRSDSESLQRTRPAPAAATYRTAGVSNEAAVLADARTPDWEPGASKGGVPKAAIGALGAALVGGVALAIVLMAPSNKATKLVALPDPIAQAAVQNAATQKSAADASVNQLDQQPPAAGAAAAPDAATQAAAVPAPVQAVIPQAPPVVNAPVARLPHHIPVPVARPMVRSAPVVTPDTPVDTPQPPAQAPAMQQIPDAPTVTPSVPTPAPADPAPAPATPDPAPAQ